MIYLKRAALVVFILAVILQVAAFYFVRIPVKTVLPGEYRWEPSKFGLVVEEVVLTSRDKVGTQFKAYKILPENGKAKAWIIVVHGINPNPSVGVGGAEFWPYALRLTDAGYGVLILDLPGYGQSAPGRGRVGVGYLEWQDVAAGYLHLKGLFPELKIGLLGKSAGTPAVLIAAAKGYGDFVVSESSIGSIRSLMGAQLKYYGFPSWSVPVLRPFAMNAWRWYLGMGFERLDPFKLVHLIEVPVLFLVGGLDPEVRQADTLELATLIGDNARVMFFPTGTHNLLRQHGGKPEVMNPELAGEIWPEVTGFVDEVTKK